MRADLVERKTKDFVRAIAEADFSALTVSELVEDFRFRVVTRLLVANEGNIVRAARAGGLHRNSMARIVGQIRSKNRVDLLAQIKTARRGRPARSVSEKLFGKRVA